MDANNETKYDIDSDRTNALQDEVDDAASDIAALSRPTQCEQRINTNTVLTRYSRTRRPRHGAPSSSA
jgi:hypothetical protein